MYFTVCDFVAPVSAFLVQKMGLVVAFLVCIILYISKLNTYKIIDDNNKTVPVNSIQTTMQKFVNIMAWIMLVVIGLSAFISVV